MADPASGGEEAFAYLLTTGIPHIVDLLIRAQSVARERGLLAARDAVAAILDELLADVNRTAVEFAGVADGLIVQKMFATQSRNRPLTGTMESHVRSQPGPLGSVRVALISELDKIVNPNGYGPFWRAQEYGTGTSEVPSQEGRLLFGTYEPSGEPPDAAQRGLGAGHDLAFIPFGDAPGEGRISVELPGRHFLRDGSTEAGALYVKAMAAIQDKYVARIRELTAQTTAAAGRRFSGRIEA